MRMTQIMKSEKQIFRIPFRSTWVLFMVALRVLPLPNGTCFTCLSIFDNSGTTREKAERSKKWSASCYDWIEVAATRQTSDDDKRAGLRDLSNKTWQIFLNFCPPARRQYVIRSVRIVQRLLRIFRACQLSPQADEETDKHRFFRLSWTGACAFSATLFSWWKAETIKNSPRYEEAEEKISWWHKRRSSASSIALAGSHLKRLRLSRDCFQIRQNTSSHAKLFLT